MEGIEMCIETIYQKPETALALKKTAISMDGISETMKEGFTRLMDYLAEQGRQIAGAPYCAYTNVNEDFSQFDVELGIPVTEPVPAQGDFHMSQTCEGKAVSIMHKGAYKDMEASYMALMEYTTKNSLELTGVFYDFYLNNPADTPESELLTKIVYMVK